MVEAGAMIGMPWKPEGVPQLFLASIAYAELWPERKILFYCANGDGSTGQQHVLHYDSVKVTSNQSIFYDSAGEIVGSIAPFDEWYIDEEEELARAFEYLTWWKAQPALKAHCQQIGRDWRTSPL
jgi:hypothetical protein